MSRIRVVVALGSPKASSSDLLIRSIGIYDISRLGSHSYTLAERARTLGAETETYEAAVSVTDTRVRRGLEFTTLRDRTPEMLPVRGAKR